MIKRKDGYQSFEQGAALLLISSVLVKLIGAFFKIPLSGEDFLGDVGFGYFSSAYDLYMPIYTLAATGLPIAVSRVVAECVAEKRFNDAQNVFMESRKLFLAVGFLGAAALSLLIYPITLLTDSTGKIFYSLLILVPSLVLCCAISVYRGYYEGIQNMMPTAVSNIIEALGKLILGLGFAYITVRLTGNVALGSAAAMSGIAMGTFLALLFLRIYYRKKGSMLSDRAAAESQFNKRQILSVITAIAIPVVLSSLSGSVVSLIDALSVKPILTRLIAADGGVIKEMFASSIDAYNAVSAKPLSDQSIPAFLYGLKGKAFTIYNLIPTFTSVLAISALPALTKCWVKGDRAEIKNTSNSILKLTCVISLPAGIGLFAVGKGIMGFLYSGAASRDIGGVMLSCYGVAACFSGISIPLTSMLQAVGCQVKALRNIAIGAVVKLVLNILLVGIPDFNIFGCAVSTVACYFIIFVLHIATFVKRVKFSPNFTSVFLKPFVSAVCSGVTAYTVIRILGEGKVIFVSALFLAVIAYFAALILLGGITKEDISLIKKSKG